MKKMGRKAISILLCLAMCLFMVTGAGSRMETYAADSIYTVTGSETAQQIEDIMSGATLDQSGTAYTGISFPAGTYNYTFTGNTTISRAFTVNVASGANVTADKGFQLASGCNLTFTGDGSYTIDGNTGYSLFSVSSDVVVNFNQTNFTIKNDAQFGIYMMKGGTMNINGGTFTVTGCALQNDCGGIEFDSGSLNVTNGAKLVAEGNGNATFGDLYMNGNMVVSGEGTTVTINATTVNARGYAMVLAGTGTLQLQDQAVMTINQKTGARGINAGSNAVNTITLSGGSTLSVNGDDKTSGIRRADVTVEDNSKLEVTGFSYALDGSLLNTSGTAFVTLDGSVVDNGSVLWFTGGTNGSVIMGGSVKEDPAASVVNGKMTAIADTQVDTTPVNAAGEELTRFDLTNMANGSVTVAADPADSTGHPGYTYQVGTDHAGTAYVWAPAVNVNFWSSEEAYQAKDTASLLQTDVTIRGNSIETVGGTMPADPTAPEGKVFTGWKNAETGEVYQSADTILSDTDVYAVYENTYTVSYAFQSGTAGAVLPANVQALLPASAQFADGTSVTPEQPAQTTVTTSDGTWTFTGYTPDQATISGADVVFTGTWTFKAAAEETTSTTAAPTVAPTTAATTAAPTTAATTTAAPTTAATTAAPTTAATTAAPTTAATTAAPTTAATTAAPTTAASTTTATTKPTPQVAADEDTVTKPSAQTTETTTAQAGEVEADEDVVTQAAQTTKLAGEVEADEDQVGTVNTGDRSNVIFWLLLVGIVGVTAGIVLLPNKGKHQNDEEN